MNTGFLNSTSNERNSRRIPYLGGQKARLDGSTKELHRVDTVEGPSELAHHDSAIFAEPKSILEKSGQPRRHLNHIKQNIMVVYASCLKNRSRSRMTDAETDGSCGTAGDPPMRAVSKNNARARANRDAPTH